GDPREGAGRPESDRLACDLTESHSIRNEWVYAAGVAGELLAVAAPSQRVLSAGRPSQRALATAEDRGRSVPARGRGSLVRRTLAITDSAAFVAAFALAEVF